MTSKTDSLVDQINQAFAGPLIDQDRNYIRYEIRVNELEYNVIRDNKWYIASNLPARVEFPSTVNAPTAEYGAMEIKAAWKELIEGKDDASRFYWTYALVLEPGLPKSCRRAKLGLIGLHIVHKVIPFREWVWSTFEHVDNVPATGDSLGKRYSLNNGTSTPVTMNGYFYPPTPGAPPTKLDPSRPLPAASDPLRTPVQVIRFTPIRADTQRINGLYQAALRGTPWEFYQALPTQWPSARNGSQFNPNGSYPADSGLPFPVRFIANTSAETYFQNSRATSCMECHFETASTDFSWMLAIRSQASGPAAVQRRDALLLRLNKAASK
jgi:hypothetical protein